MDKDKAKLTEREKFHAGEPFDHAKMHSEMDDHFWDSVMEGLRETPFPERHKDHVGHPDDMP